MAGEIMKSDRGYPSIGLVNSGALLGNLGDKGPIRSDQWCENPTRHRVYPHNQKPGPEERDNMGKTKMTRGSVALVIGLALSVGTATPAEAAVKKYSNCAKLNKDFPHGVGKPGARDKTSGAPVSNFTRNKKVYDKNKKARDRDKDGIACEKR